MKVTVVVSELVSCVGVILVVIVEVTDTSSLVSRLDESTGPVTVVISD